MSLHVDPDRLKATLLELSHIGCNEALGISY